MSAVELEHVVRLVDALSPSEKRRLIAHLSDQLEVASVGGTLHGEPADGAYRLWPSKFAGKAKRTTATQEIQDDTAAPPSRVAGLNAGEVWMSDDFNAELPAEFWFGEL
jgi:hypothetical protein